MTAAFSSDITAQGAISLTTAAGEVFQSHPIGLFYADSASGKVAQIGAAQASVGTLYPPNVIVFSNILSGVRADLMLVWAKNGFEQNLVIKQSPPPPGSFGLSSSTTTLQLWTAMDSVPVPQEVRPVPLDSGLEDHILIFQSAWFPVGAAFAFGDTSLPPAGQAAAVRPLRPSEPGTVPTAKSLVNISGQQVLIEEVRFSDLAAALSQLPQASLSSRPNQAVQVAERGMFLKPNAKPIPARQPMEVASSQYHPQGVVLDYIELTGGASSYTFASNSTYHIASGFEVGSGTATFQQNTCIKLDTNAYLLVYGGVSCPGSGPPAVLTSRDDNGYGAIITNSTANPGYAAAQALWMYYESSGTVLNDLLVRWAQRGVQYDTAAVDYPQLSSSALQDCKVGVDLNTGLDTLNLYQVTECNVLTPISNPRGWLIAGSITTNCGVVSVAMVNDPNQDLSGLDTNKNSQTECSFVVCDSTNIVAAFMNTHLSEYVLGEDTFSGIQSPRTTSWGISTNGGTNFTDQGPLLPLSTITSGSTVITNGASDPMHGDAGDTTMAYDSGSNVVYLFLNTSREHTNWYGGRLWASTDKGKTFNPINMDVPGLDTNGQHRVMWEDKPMIKVSSVNHNAYVAATGVTNGTKYLWAAVSSNGGTNWSLFQMLERVTNGDARGVDIVIVPDGTVYFVWLHQDNGPSGAVTNSFHYAWLSTNNTWSALARIGPSLNSTNANASGRLFRSSGADSLDYLDDNAFPRVAYANGNIYITYADLPSANNRTKDRGDIFLIEASVNWSTHALSLNYGPRVVNNDSTQTDQWNPSIAANPSGTELFIGYYSRQNDPTTNSRAMSYAAKAFITNGLSLATFECIPVSSTNFLLLFNGTTNSTPPWESWLFDDTWAQGLVCLNGSNAVYDGYATNSLCFNLTDDDTTTVYMHFCADDYTWSSADSNFFYFAWCDRSRIFGTLPNARPDADVRFAKIKP